MYILQYFLIHRLVSFSFFRVGRFEVRFLGQKWRFGRFRFIPSLFQHYCTDEGKRACILVPSCLSKLLEPAKMATGCSKQLGKINWDWYMRSLSLVSALLPAVPNLKPCCWEICISRNRVRRGVMLQWTKKISLKIILPKQPSVVIDWYCKRLKSWLLGTFM